ncbi:peptidylprolyl isomerase [Chitinimonas koreensis]|uniref:peptidylprolyl isomerase n=1 Tax=Chitinimonas koreensis TaxID=356302 RepID=UPI00041C1373|nr:peptidylprolyl isomerase [Chitinimonas koreensis]QNM97748.1 peptidylprolyl isomerase [Chitinimonas koreensis]
MFEFVHNNRRLVGVALGLVVLGLMVGGGVAGYSAVGGEVFLAKVDGVKITERDLADAAGGQAVPDAMKPQLVQQLVQRQLLLGESAKRHVLADDARLREQILQIDAFKDNGKFSKEQYERLLAARQMTVDQFEKKLREDLAVQLLAGSLGDSAFGSRLAAARLSSALVEPRTVESHAYTAEGFMAQAAVGEDKVKQYYDAHLSDYRQPERVKLAYVVLSKEELAQKVTIEPAKLQRYFDEHKNELAPEERQVRHILIQADKSATAEQKAAARKKAEGILAELKQNPAKFAELAKQHSQDPGSAAQGGDLGFFGRGAMVKPFEDVAFKLAKGELSDVVETDFGYHVLQLEAIKTKTFDELKPVIEQRLKQEEAQKRFQAEIEKFSDLAYQQADSLQPLVDAYGLTLRNSDWMTREASPDPQLNTPKLREAVFAEDVLKNKHNSEAVEVAPGTLLVARVAQHEPAKQQALAEVAPAITDKLKREAAEKLARDAGQKTLAALRKGETVAVEWTPAVTASRIQPQGLAKTAVDAVFAVATPGYAGVEVPGGYTVYRVAKAAAPAQDQAALAGLQASLGRVGSEQALAAYLAGLRTRAKVETR